MSTPFDESKINRSAVTGKFEDKPEAGLAGELLGDQDHAPDLTNPRDLAEAVIAGHVTNPMDHAGNWDEGEWEEYREYGASLQADLTERHASNYLGVNTTSFTSEIDGALVVEVDTSDGPVDQQIRVIVNDGAVYDEDPEKGSVAGTVAGHLVESSRCEREGETRKAHAAAMEGFHAAKDHLERLTQKAIATSLAEGWPQAHYALLEESDQGEGYVLVGLAGTDGTNLGVDSDDLDTHDEDLWTMASDLRAHCRAVEVEVVDDRFVQRLNLFRATAL